MDYTDTQLPPVSGSRIVAPEDFARLHHWSQRKPAIALMGEFSAGKSTLLNFLLRKEFLPTQVTATQLPPVWLSYGTAAPYVMYEDGRRQVVDLERISDIPVAGTRFLRIFMEADILEAVDLIDTPGISDPKIPSEVWRRAVGYVNGVIWCTHATQAWRESERAAWVSLPERLRHNSLLLVTRADKLGEKDRQKVLRRVNREAGSLFSKSILFSALDAIQARDHAGGADLWVKSGGEKLVDAIFSVISDVIETRADRIKRYASDPSLLSQPKRPTVVELHAPGAPLMEAPKVDIEREQTIEEKLDATVVIRPVPQRPRRVIAGERTTERPSERIDLVAAQKMRDTLLDATAPTEAFDAVPERPISETIIEVANDLPEFSEPLVLTSPVEVMAEPDESEAEDLTISELPDVDFSASIARILEETIATEVPEEVEVDDMLPDVVSDDLNIGALLQQIPEPMNENVAPDLTSPDLILDAVAPLEPEQPLTVGGIWNNVLAQGRPETMDELLAAIGRLLTEIDDQAVFAAGGDTPKGPSNPSPENGNWHAL